MNDLVNIGAVRAFADVKPDKAQALKPLEEAAEAFGAWQNMLRVPGGMVFPFARNALVDEIADVIQACVNLAVALGVEDLTDAMTRCEQRNRLRGRYGEEER